MVFAIRLILAIGIVAVMCCCNTTVLAQTASHLEFASSDKRLEDLFHWAQTTALRYVGKDDDPVGPWYEAALPGREAFCIRDASHQCIGAEILGLSRQNLNMFRHFVGGIAESRDYCSYWEIDRLNRPAPVDYASDDDFWYPLNANFDIIDACNRLYHWTGYTEYVSGGAFDRFFRLSLNEFVDKWQLQPDRILGRQPIMNLKPSTIQYRETRGLPSYDEQQNDIAVGGDLLGMIANGFRTYADILKSRGDTERSQEYRRKAALYLKQIEQKWWNPAANNHYDFWTTAGKFRSGGTGGNEYLLWQRAVKDPERITASLRAIRNTQVEVLSYLPMLYYRYGLNQEAYDLLVKLYQNPRRDYPEASYAAIEALFSGMMGIEPMGGQGIIATCSRLLPGTDWASAKHVPLMGLQLSVSHKSNTDTTLQNESDKRFTWRAEFVGNHPILFVNGRSRNSKHIKNGLGAIYSYVDVAVKPHSEAHVKTGGG